MKKALAGFLFVACCAACRAQPYVELFFSHFTAVCDHLRAKGARAMMWHDMLLKAGDPRWKGFQANGTDETEAPRRGYYGTLSFCNHWRQIGWDMKSGDYRNTGITDDQTTRSILAE